MRRTLAFFTVFLVGLLLVCASASATTYLVKPDGTGDFPAIQDAVNAAEDGDVIELADGVFTGAGNRDIDYLGKTITVRSQNGNPESCTIDLEGGHRGFMFQSGETREAILEGVTITNGYVGAGQQGGAVLCDDGASPAIRDCIFEQSQGDGGGALACPGASPTVIRCEFIGNQAVRGGAIFAQGYGAAPEVTDCRFSDNAASNQGGAINVYNHAHLTATGCLFSENQGPMGGAIYFFNCTGTVSQSFFSGNSGTIGGAVLSYIDSATEFEGCTFVENSGNYGGGMGCYTASTAASQCTFVSNAASTQGGGLHLSDTGMVLENCIIAFSGQGEAVTCSGVADATLSCCDLFGNAGGDWVGCVADQLGITGNISENPRFCGALNPEEPYTLQEDSPCAPEVNPFCGLIGAWPVGCGSTSGIPEDGPIHKPATWGQIKAGTGN